MFSAIGVEKSKLQEQFGPDILIFKYSTTTGSYSAREVLDKLFCGIPPEKLCQRKPVGVSTFASFVVDLNSVPLQDLNADDNGAWITSSPRRTYKVEFLDDHVVVATPLSNEASEVNGNIYTFIRQYGTHKGTPADNSNGI